MRPIVRRTGTFCLENLTQADYDADKPYAPLSAADVHQVYYPTVLPVASGGYFWVFFDSTRNYGNKGQQRQLWGAAVTVSADGKYEVDPSHPAFYVGGQEFDSANHRAFTALDPCRVDGDKCTSGVDCCGGKCEIEGGEFGDVGMCHSNTGSCSDIDEACKTAGDCCDPSASCINGYCATLVLL